MYRRYGPVQNFPGDMPNKNSNSGPFEKRDNPSGHRPQAKRLPVQGQQSQRPSGQRPSGQRPQGQRPAVQEPPVQEPLPKKERRQQHPFMRFIPQSLYNPETGKVFGFLSPDDLLVVALILMILDGGEDKEDNSMLLYALLYILLSEHIDLPF